MCSTCLLKTGIHRSFSSIALNSPKLLQPDNAQTRIKRGRCIFEQPKRTHVLYFIMRDRENDKKRHGKEPGPKFTRQYGLEGSIARELISYGANVHFTNGTWYGRKALTGWKSWRVWNPGPEATDFTVNAVDATDSFVNQGAIESMAKNLPNVRYLNLDGCKYVDDHCLASLVHMKDSLTHLSVNRCNQITDGGLANLHRLRNLKRLNMNELPLVVNAKLVAVMLEDCIPDLRIGMVTDQIEEYKAKVKLLQASGQATEEMEDLLKISEQLPEESSESVSGQLDSMDKEDDTGRTVEDDVVTEKNDASSEWTDLIREKRP